MMKETLLAYVAQFRRAFGKGLFTDIATMTLCTAIGQGVVFLSYPFLATIYSPIDFGSFAIYLSFSTIFGVFSTLRYEVAIPIAIDNREALNIAALCGLAILAMAIVAAIILNFFGSPLFNLLKIRQIEGLSFFITVAVLEIGLFQVVTNWAIRSKNFNRIAITKLIQGFTLVLIQILLGIGGAKQIGLIVGDLASKLVCVLILGTVMLKSKNAGKIHIQEILRCAKRYIRFPKMSLTAAGLNSVIAEIPIFLISFAYGEKSLGLMSMANRITGLPMQFLAQSVSQVYWKEYSFLKSSDKNKLAMMMIHSTLLMASICIPYAVLLMSIGPLVLPRVLGNDWLGVGKVLPFLAPMIAIQSIASPAGVMLDVLERQDLHLLREIFRMVIFIIGGFILVLNGLTFISGLVVLMISGILAAVLYWLASYIPAIIFSRRA